MVIICYNAGEDSYEKGTIMVMSESPQVPTKKTNWFIKAVIAVGLVLAVVPLLIVIPAVTGNPMSAVVTFAVLTLLVSWELSRYYWLANQLNMLRYLVALAVILIAGMLAGMFVSVTGGVFGTVAVLLVAASNAPADIGAQLFGRAYGKRRLPAPLNNKTWEGVAGGVVLGWAGGSLAYLLTDALWVTLPAAMWAIVAATPPLAMAGDIYQSLVKRYLGIKDMSEILRDHGGFSERTDSPAVPLIVALVVLKVVMGL